MWDANNLFFNHVSSGGDSEINNLDTIIATVESYARINNQSCFIIDFDRHELIYRTRRLLYLDETTIKDKMRDCANPYWSFVSEKTLRYLFYIKENYPLIGKQIYLEQYGSHICKIDYPIIINNNEIYISQKFTPLQIHSDGVPNIGLFIINYSVKKEFECNIFISSGKRFKFDFKENRFLEDNIDTTLSSTEKAILRRAKEGMTNEEISESLYLSVNTVKTHRMRIFKKFNVKTIIEALSLAENYQLL